MKYLICTAMTLTLATAVSLPSSAQSASAKPGNCAILAEMSAQTVKKDERFKEHKNIAPSLMKFSKAQTAKLEAGMADTYKASKAFGWDKAKVDKMMKDTDAAMRKGFFTSTMDKNKLYMDHVQAVYACANAQTKPADLGQSPEDLVTNLKQMAEIVRG